MTTDSLRIAFLLGEAIGIAESIAKYDRSRWAQKRVDEAWEATYASLRSAYGRGALDAYGYAALRDLIDKARAS